MRQKWIVCFLICVMLLSAVNAGAAMRFGTVTPESGVEGVTVTKESDSQIQVVYPGQKGQQYTVWAVSAAGIDTTTGKPTKASIDNNQGNVIGYMDQKSGGDDGNVEFNVMAGPMLDGAEEGTEYSIFVSSKNGTEDVMDRVALFSIIDEGIDVLGDANGDGVVDGQDVSLCIDNFMKGIALTAEQEKALDVNYDNVLDGQDVSAITDYFMKGVAFS